MNVSSSSSLSVEKKLSATALSQHCRGRESDWSMPCSLMRRPADVKRDSEVSPSSSPRLPFLRRTRPQPRFHSHSLWTPLGVRCTLGSDRVKTLLSARRSADDQMPVVFDRGHWRSRLRLRRLVFAVLRVGVTSGRVRTVIRLVEDSLFLWMAGVEIKCSSSRLHPAAWRCARARRPRQ